MFNSMLQIQLFVVLLIIISFTQISSASPFLSDTFDGSVGSPPDITKWTTAEPGDSSIALNGSGEAVITPPSPTSVNATASITSVDTFSPEIIVEFDISSFGTGNGGMQIRNASFSQYVILSSSTNNILVKGPGGTDSTAIGSLKYKDLGSFIAQITWTADLLKVTVNGDEKYVTTDPNFIPTDSLLVGVGKQRGGSPAVIDSITVSAVPEPASLMLCGLGLTFIMRRSHNALQN